MSWTLSGAPGGWTVTKQKSPEFMRKNAGPVNFVKMEQCDLWVEGDGWVHATMIKQGSESHSKMWQERLTSLCLGLWLPVLTRIICEYLDDMLGLYLQGHAVIWRDPLDLTIAPLDTQVEKAPVFREHGLHDHKRSLVNSMCSRCLVSPLIPVMACEISKTCDHFGVKCDACGFCMLICGPCNEVL